MKKTFKKITAMFLTALFMINLLPAYVFAFSGISKEAESALNFIESKNLLCGEILAVKEIEDGFEFKVNYLGENNDSYLVFKEKNNEKSVTVIENEIINEIVFKEDGTVTLDGVQTTIFNNTNIMPLSTYASAFYETMPASASGTYTYFDQISGNIVTEFVIKSLTTNVLASYISAALGVPAIVVKAAAALIKTTANTYNDNGLMLTYVRKVYKNNKDYPLNIYFRHDIDYRLVCGQKVYATFYEVETLV